MKATAIHGYVAFVQREPEEKVTRKEAAESMNEIALAIVSAGDIGDPKAQVFRAAIEKAVKEFTQPGGDTKPISAREAARRRMPLDGADAQALEGALTLTERERDAYKKAKEENDARFMRERDEARAEVERLRRDWAATQNALNLAAYERDEDRTEDAVKSPSEPYTFRGGYIEDAAGDRWWSSELLAKVEKERDQLKEELEKLHRLAPTGTYTANVTYEMQLLTVKQERDEARAEVERLRWLAEAGCENTPTKGCECPGCCTARERAERGEA